MWNLGHCYIVNCWNRKNKTSFHTYSFSNLAIKTFRSIIICLLFPPSCTCYVLCPFFSSTSKYILRIFLCCNHVNKFLIPSLELFWPYTCWRIMCTSTLFVPISCAVFKGHTSYKFAVSMCKILRVYFLFFSWS